MPQKKPLPIQEKDSDPDDHDIIVKVENDKRCVYHLHLQLVFISVVFLNRLFDLPAISRSQKAHRSVLKAGSKYFEILLSSNFKEKNAEIVTLSGMNYETMDLVLGIIYGEEFKFSKHCSPVDAIVAADYLLAKPAIKTLSQYVENNVTHKNAIELYRVSDKLNDAARDYLEIYISRHITELEDVLKLDNELFCKLLKSNTKDLDACRSIGVIKKWVLVDPDERSKFLYELFSAIESTIQLKHMSVHFIMSEIVPICQSEMTLKFAIALLAKKSRYNGPLVRQYLPTVVNTDNNLFDRMRL